MEVFKPRKVIIEKRVKDSLIAQRIRNSLPEVLFEYVDQVSEISPKDPLNLELVHFKGRMIKSCPGTRHYLCCGYRILHFGTQCSLGCTYCILQAYLKEPNLRLFANTDELFQQLACELASFPLNVYRIGTGEFTDSLLLDPITGFSKELISFFAGFPNALLELKTKTDFIHNLEGLEHGGHTVVAWSLNARDVIEREEPFAASMDERLAAARRCAEWGYGLAFHFDPMIAYEGWERGYGDVLEELFSTVDPRHIVWISLGAFRFMPELKSIIVGNHPESRIVYGEFIQGLDGKMRYFRDIRVELFRFMVERIRQVDPGICVYLCMEGRDIWRDVFGFIPEQKGGLSAILDQAALGWIKRCRF